MNTTSIFTSDGGGGGGGGGDDGVRTGPTKRRLQAVAREVSERSPGDTTPPFAPSRIQPRYTGHCLLRIDSAALPAATIEYALPPFGRYEYRTVQDSMFLGESFTDDDQQSFEYESLALLPSFPLLPPVSGVKVYSLVPALGRTSHCLGAFALADCKVTRPPHSELDRYRVPHDSARDCIV